MQVARLSSSVSLFGRVVLAASLGAAMSAAAGASSYNPMGPMGPYYSPSAGAARFAVALPLRNRPGLDAFLARVQDPSSPDYHKFLTPTQFASLYGPSSASKAAIAKELTAAGFTVRVGSQAVYAHGTQQAAERYFHTNFALRFPENQPRATLTPATPLLRSTLLQSLQARVIGLDGLPDAKPNAVFGPREPRHIRLPLSVAGPKGPYLAPDLKQAYSFPSYALATGKGVTIGIISSSPINPADLKDYFGDADEPVPTLTEFAIDGGGQYSASGDATGEVTLDAEQAGGSAPQASIGNFDVPDLSSGNLLEAYDVAMEAGSDIVSSSIGGCEKADTGSPGIYTIEALDNVFAEGSSEGVTWVGASGDNAAYQCGTNTTSASVGVQTPTDDPIMLGIGGTTTLTTTYSASSDNSAYVSETSYDSTFTGHGGALWGSGGGYSVIFALPAYQKGFVTYAHRGVPDLAMHMGGPASSNSGDYLIVGGNVETVFGTSAAAPEFAGLLALRVQLAKAKQGDLHNYFYTNAKKAGMFRHGIAGNNGYPSNTTLWDPVLGLGTPFGRFITGTPTAALAGVPGTSTNP